MLEAKNINFKYKNGRQILKNVGFELHKGEFLAILGNNGVGKSTLMKCLNKILKADSGEFYLNDEDMFNMSQKEVAKRIAFIAQNVPNAQMTVHDVMMLGRRPFMNFNFTEEDHMIVHEVMHNLGIEDMRGAYLNELSGGERQKVMLGRALVQQPQLLLLDELTSSLDINNQYQVLEIAKDFCHKENKMAIVVIHDLSLALRFCDKFMLIKNGEVYDYGDSSCINTQSLKDIYEIDAKVVEIEGIKTVLVDKANW